MRHQDSKTMIPSGFEPGIGWKVKTAARVRAWLLPATGSAPGIQEIKVKHGTVRRKARGWLLGFSLALAGTAAWAQDASQKIVQELDALEPGSAASALPLPADPLQIRTLAQSASQRVPLRVLVLPELANAKAALAAPAPGRPLQIGVGRALPDAADAAATDRLLTWTRTADGSQRAALGVRAPGAKGLRLGLRVDQLPQGARLRVYAPDTAETIEIAATEVLRTIQTNLNAGDNSAAARTYWLPMVQGTEAALEIELPAGVSPAQLKVSLPSVSHLTILPSDDQAIAKALSPECSVDAMCTSGNENEMRAVAMMMFTLSNGNTTYCTGTLLNNSKNDRTPYFLSANHCISTQTVASTLQTEWKWRSASCDSTKIDSAYTSVLGGAQLLYNNADSDTAFMRLNGSPPADAFFAGWDATAANLNTAVFGIHHPEGRVQEYAEGAIAGFTTCWPYSDGSFDCNANDLTPGSNNHYDVTFSRGLPISGSSGSALFTRDGRRIIGQYHGGEMNCYNPTKNFYGRFDLAYNAGLYRWLGSAPVSYAITGYAYAGGTISPASAQVQSGQTYTFTVTPNSGYYIALISGCNGTQFTGNNTNTTARTYTTGAVTGNCTVTAQFAQGTSTYTVSGSAYAGGTISPASAQVQSGQTYTFTVTPNSGYYISSISGCNGSAYTGNSSSTTARTYTTGAVTGNCTVTAQFAQGTPTYTVSGSAYAGGTISPASAQVQSGQTYTFTVTPNSGYYISSISGCNGMAYTGNSASTTARTYTTGAITSACTVYAQFAQGTPTYTVSGYVGADGGTISPASAQVQSGQTYTFTVTPNSGYYISSISGCNGTMFTGTSANTAARTYTTGAVTSNCTVTARFEKLGTYTISIQTSSIGGTISPTSAQVNPGATYTFTVIPDAGYYIAQVWGCNGTMFTGTSANTNTVSFAQNVIKLNSES